MNYGRREAGESVRHSFSLIAGESFETLTSVPTKKKPKNKKGEQNSSASDETNHPQNKERKENFFSSPGTIRDFLRFRTLSRTDPKQFLIAFAKKQ